MLEVTYLKSFEQEGEKFGKATVTCTCGWVHKVTESYEDFDAAVRQTMEDHKCKKEG